MQKLISRRALDGVSGHHSRQPSRRRGLGCRRVPYVHLRRLIEARDRGARLLLISEDLDEIQHAVRPSGDPSRTPVPPSLRGELSVMELGN